MGPRAPLPTAAVRVPTPASRPPQGPEHSPESPGLLCASPSPSFPASFWGLLSCTFPPNAGFLFDWFFFPPPAARTLPCPTQPGLFIARCLLEGTGDKTGGCWGPKGTQPAGAPAGEGTASGPRGVAYRSGSAATGSCLASCGTQSPNENNHYLGLHFPHPSSFLLWTFCGIWICYCKPKL